MREKENTRTNYICHSLFVFKEGFWRGLCQERWVLTKTHKRINIFHKGSPFLASSSSKDFGKFFNQNRWRYTKYEREWDKKRSLFFFLILNILIHTLGDERKFKKNWQWCISKKVTLGYTTQVRRWEKV